MSSYSPLTFIQFSTSPYDPTRLPPAVFVPPLLLILPLFFLDLVILVHAPPESPYPCVWCEALMQTIALPSLFIVLITLRQKALTQHIQSPVKQFLVALAGCVLGAACMYTSMVMRLLYLAQGGSGTATAARMIALEAVDIALCFPCSIMSVRNMGYFLHVWWRGQCHWNNFYVVTACIQARRLEQKETGNISCAICGDACNSAKDNKGEPMLRSGRKAFHRSCFAALVADEDMAGLLAFTGVSTWETFYKTLVIYASPSMKAQVTVRCCRRVEPISCAAFCPTVSVRGGSIRIISLQPGQEVGDSSLKVPNLLSRFFRLPSENGHTAHTHRSIIANDVLYHTNCSGTAMFRYDPALHNSHRIAFQGDEQWTVSDSRHLVSLSSIVSHSCERCVVAVTDLLDEEGEPARYDVTRERGKISIDGGLAQVQPGTVRISGAEEGVFNLQSRRLERLKRVIEDRDEVSERTAAGVEEEDLLNGNSSMQGIELIIAK